MKELSTKERCDLWKLNRFSRVHPLQRESDFWRYFVCEEDPQVFLLKRYGDIFYLLNIAQAFLKNLGLEVKNEDVAYVLKCLVKFSGQAHIVKACQSFKHYKTPQVEAVALFFQDNADNPTSDLLAVGFNFEAQWKNAQYLYRLSTGISLIPENPLVVKMLFEHSRRLVTGPRQKDLLPMEEVLRVLRKDIDWLRRQSLTD